MKRLKKLATPGHAIAALVFVVVIYFMWGKFFEPGGTGSNVVLGLLVALALIYLGGTNFGPSIDDVIAGKKGPFRKALREAHEMLEDVDAAIARAKKGSLKNAHKKKLGDDEIAALTAGREAFAAAVTEAAKAEQVKAIEDGARALEEQLHKVLGNQQTGVLVQVRGLLGAFTIAVVLRLWLVAPFQIPSGSMIPTLLIGDHLFVFRASYGLQIPTKLGGKLSWLTGFLPDQPFYFLRWSLPERGDVVVFEAPPWVPQNAGEDWIKRVIALPGQKVKRDEITVYVDGQPYNEVGSTMTRYMDFEELPGGRGIWKESTGDLHVEEIPGRPHQTFTDMPPKTTDWPNLAFPYPQMKGLSCNAEECTVNEGYVFVMGDNRDHSSDGRVWGAVPVDAIKGRALFIWVSVDGSEESVHLGRFTLPRFRWDRLFDWIQ